MDGLDLSGVIGFVDADILVDTLLFSRDFGPADDTLDEAGDLITNEPWTLYSGPGAVQPIDGFSQVTDPDVQRILQTTDAKYRALLPLSNTVEFRAGDLCRVTAQGGKNPNPLLTGRRFEVVELGTVATIGVVQVVYLKQLAPPEPAP